MKIVEIIGIIVAFFALLIFGIPPLMWLGRKVEKQMDRYGEWWYRH